MLQQILALRRERADLLTKAGRILTKCQKAGREPTAAENARFDRMHADGDKLLAKIQRLERQRVSAETMDQIAPAGSVGNPALAGVRSDHQVAAFTAWCRGDMRLLRSSRLAPAAKALGLRPGANKAKLRIGTRAPRTLVAAQNAHQAVEKRAMGVATGAGGGYSVPEGFHSAVEVALLAHGGMREVATILRTATGNPLPMPSVNDANQMGEQLDENVGAGVQDVAMGRAMLDAYKYSSKVVPVSIELMQDEAVGLESLLGRLLGERIARILNQRLTVGTGVDQPHGMVTASVLGHTAVAQAALTRNELLDLKHSVNAAYRVGAQWSWADSTLLAVKKLLDANGQPLWTPGKVAEGEPDRFDGDPYVVNDDVPAMAAGAKAVVYGQLSKYHIRDVLDFDLHVLRERYIDQGQIGFLAFSRHDGELIDAGTNPIKHLAMAP